MEVCSEVGCCRSVKVRGLCTKHYHDLLHSGALPRLHNKNLFNEIHKTALAGRVRVLSGADAADECVIKERGGKVLLLKVDGKTTTAAKYICTIVHGRPKKGEFAAHSCGNIKCVEPTHLSWCSRAVIGINCVNSGSSPAGSRNFNAKLTEENVLDMIDLFAHGKSISTIAKTHGVHYSTARGIVKGSSWKTALLRHAATSGGASGA